MPTAARWKDDGQEDGHAVKVAIKDEGKHQMTDGIYSRLHLAPAWRHWVVVGLVTIVLALSGAATAQSSLPLALGEPFTDNLVLQRGRPVPIWGVGRPGADVIVTLDAAEARTQVGADGHWRAVLPPMSVVHDASLTVRSEADELLTLHHVAVGDVWLCSGQSNMEFTVAQATNADQELAQSDDVGLRLLLVPRQRLLQAGERFAQPSRWLAANAESAREFSAACYYMGRELRDRLAIPIGLIAASWGGSRIEDWLGEATLRRHGGFDDSLAAAENHRLDPEGTERIANAALESWLIAQRPGPQEHQDDAVEADPMAGLWEQWDIAALANFDGIGVYHTTVTLTAEQAAAASNMVIGNVDDVDLTLVNNTRVGVTVGWNRPRNYALPASLVHAGTNVVEIIVLDTGAGGGVWGGGERGLVLADGSIVPFDTQWTFTRGNPLADLGPVPMPPWVNGEGLATLHNGMIAPLGQYALHGVAWYQGESNASRASAYPALLGAWADDLRSRFDARQFLVIQLAGFGALEDAAVPSNWAELREAQRNFANAHQDVALIPTIDIGDRFDIHPTNKLEVGRRLALAATASEWNAGEELAYTRSANNVVVRLPRSFRLLGGTVHPAGFAICDGDGECQFATAQLAGGDRVIVPITDSTREIRYLWANNALVSLFGSDGVPLVPFRLRVTQ